VKRVVLTLTSGALAGLAGVLAGRRIAVEECPLLRMQPPDDWRPLDEALAALGRYPTMALTSPRAAAAVAERWRRHGYPLPPGAGDRGNPNAGKRPAIWAAGPASAAPLGDLLGPVRTPDLHQAAPAERGVGAGESLARAMLAARAESPVLYPCGESHREGLTLILTSAGLRVDEVVSYRSVLADPDLARHAVERADLLIVGSPRVAELLGTVAGGRRPRLLALGPTSAAASRRLGWPPDGVADRPNVEEVVAQVVRLLA
jgi:uroporphyrinogen-III synthase